MTQRKDNGQYSSRFLTIVFAFLFSLLFLLTACGFRTTAGSATASASTVTSSHSKTLILAFVCKESPGGGFFVLEGDSHARVCVQTAPHVALTITVKFCNGTVDHSRQLRGMVYADSSGYYEWNWTPLTDCKAIVWRGQADVTAYLNGQKKSLSTAFFRD